MAFKFVEVIQWVDSVELARVDEARVEIGDVSAILGLEEVRVLTMKDNLFQRSFANVVVQRGPGFVQEESQFLPVIEHVRDGLAETRIGFHSPLIELAMEPLVKLIHGRAAMGLVEEQSRLG